MHRLYLERIVNVTHIPKPTALTSPRFILSKFSFLTTPSDTSKLSAQHFSSTISLLVGDDGS
jgi:hypothetical protein